MCVGLISRREEGGGGGCSWKGFTAFGLHMAQTEAVCTGMIHALCTGVRLNRIVMPIND